MTYSKHTSLRSALGKVASLSDAPEDMIRQMLRDRPPTPFYKTPEFQGGVAAAAVPIVLSAGMSGARALFRAQRKAHVFKKTLESNPHLKGFDAKATQRYFSTLYRVNPEMAGDPTVAGTFIQNQHELSDATFPNRGIIAGATEVAKLRESMSKGRMSSKSPGAGRGVVDMATAGIKGHAQGEEERQERIYLNTRLMKGDIPANFGERTGGGYFDRDKAQRRDSR